MVMAIEDVAMMDGACEVNAAAADIDGRRMHYAISIGAMLLPLH